MRKVTFISGLVKSEVMAGNHLEYYRYSRPDWGVSVRGEDTVLDTPAVDRVVVPVHHICDWRGGAHKDTYIAYSKEVEELLGAPIQAIVDGAKAANAEAGEQRANAQRALCEVATARLTVEKAGVLQRLRYLFSPKTLLQE